MYLPYLSQRAGFLRGRRHPATLKLRTVQIQSPRRCPVPLGGRPKSVRVECGKRASQTRLQQSFFGLPCGGPRAQIQTHTSQQLHVAGLIDNVIKNQYCGDYPSSRIFLVAGKCICLPGCTETHEITKVGGKTKYPSTRA